MIGTSSVFVALAFLVACSAPSSTGGDNGNPDAGVDVGEGEGEEGEGEGGEGEGEEGEGENGIGEGEGEEGEGEGEGEGGIQGNVYQGAAEDGVVCGDSTCALATACCVNILTSTATCAGNNGCMGGATVLPLNCDGPEECTDPAAPVCCARFSGSTCVADGACTGMNTFETCVTGADCADGSDCCTSDLLSGVGVDAGVCAVRGAGGEICALPGQ
jgi:hypothetical protein